MLGVATLAWFAFTDSTSGDLILNTSNLDLAYEFFVFQDSNFNGATNENITSNTCEDEEEMSCYLFIPNPTSAHVIAGSRNIVPSDRFSFALKVTNIGNIAGRLKLILTQLSSIGYGSIEQNKVQTAFSYSIDKITYVDDGVESPDMKDSFDAIYAGMDEVTIHFGINDSGLYELGSHIKVESSGEYQVVIIYFNLYFDPSISGYDELLQPTMNSNPFQNQTFTLNQIIIDLSVDY
jgi:hypothetical protein